jgi:hypothetical protein
MLRASSRYEGRPPHATLYAGLDLSRKRLDFCLLDQAGETVEIGAAPPDADGLRPSTATATNTPSSASANNAAPRSAQTDLARRLTEAIWHMLTQNQPFAPASAANRLAA